MAAPAATEETLEGYGHLLAGGSSGKLTERNLKAAKGFTQMARNSKTNFQAPIA